MSELLKRHLHVTTVSSNPYWNPNSLWFSCRFQLIGKHLRGGYRRITEECLIKQTSFQESTEIELNYILLDLRLNSVLWSHGLNIDMKNHARSYHQIPYHALVKAKRILKRISMHVDIETTLHLFILTRP